MTRRNYESGYALRRENLYQLKAPRKDDVLHFEQGGDYLRIGHAGVYLDQEDQRRAPRRILVDEDGWIVYGTMVNGRSSGQRLILAPSDLRSIRDSSSGFEEWYSDGGFLMITPGGVSPYTMAFDLRRLHQEFPL